MRAQGVGFRKQIFGAAGAVLLLFACSAFGQAAVDKNFAVFISDTHIAEEVGDDPCNATNASGRLSICVQKVLAKKP